MPEGKKNKGGRRRQYTVEEHIARGTYRADRHGPRPDAVDVKPTFVNLTQKPAPCEPGDVPREWIRSPADEAAIAAGYWFDPALGQYACDWIESNLVLTEGIWSGEPFELMPYQRDFLMRLFGWVRYTEDWGGRVVQRYRRALLLVAKKNGKSPFGAALGLFLAFGNYEADRAELGADVVVVARNKIQAENVGKHCRRMVRHCPTLADACSINEHQCRITHTKSEALCRTMAHDPDALEGLNLTACIADELHIWRKSSTWDSIRYAGASRPNFLLLAISTSGDDRTSLCYEQYEYAKGVEAGHVIDHEFLGVIYEADEADDWTDPDTWQKANPALGITVMKSELAAACAEAKQQTRRQPAFKRYRLNIWSQSESAWLDLEYWNACRADFGEADFAGRECVAALDLSKTRDTTALVLMFRDGDDLYQLPYFWLPDETARRMNATVPYLKWAEAGYIKLTEGATVSYPTVLADMLELAERFTITHLIYDPWNAAHLTEQFETETGVERVEFTQVISNFNAPAKEYERRLINGNLYHPGNDVLTWQASHVLIYSDPNENIRPIKRSEGDYRKVDGIVAGVMATAQAMLDPPDTNWSMVV